MRPLTLDASSVPVDGLRRHPARIGPNAIIQLSAAVTARLGNEARDALFRRAGLQRYLRAMPENMVDEAEVIALHRALRASVTAEAARDLFYEAGLLTGDYILANRIPKPAQVILKLLPRGLATRALTAAIGKHAWTFAGSGSFRAVSTQPLVLEIANSPLCRGETADTPLCDYYAGTFTRLYRTLADAETDIRETSCGAVAGGACRFEDRPDRRPGHPGA
ncbi:MAG: bacteriochlorophyll 4-vinyl reductase [Hyphomicrobium sp. 32-62-53]|nr:MAG: bacteriochlorophyll 4-vinyl reductase [Hyphomicrobium sp. 12-62-95]OYX99719.1 MAG: bacteriochlorophyll 4-vinyl reductase [Hyphomicrobium sp. 32-62-53]